MNVDFSHPANEVILRFCRNPYDFIVGPRSRRFREARENDLSNSRIKESQSPGSVNRLNLGTHPDVVERFWSEITVLLPERCRWVVYGGPVLVCPLNGVIFGWAGGSFDYSLRLPKDLYQEAVDAGAKTTSRYSTGDTLDLARIGGEWIFGSWLKEEETWCLQAYEYARKLARG